MIHETGAILMVFYLFIFIFYIKITLASPYMHIEQQKSLLSLQCSFAYHRGVPQDFLWPGHSFMIHTAGAILMVRSKE